MNILILSALFSVIVHNSSLPNFLSKISLELNQICNEQIHENYKNKELLAALVCGNKIEDKQHNEVLTKTSLIHIFVVSGAHLIFVEQFFSFFPFWLRVFLLSVYALMSLAQPPVARALTQLLLLNYFKLNGANLKIWQLTFLSTAIVIIFNLNWIHSRSLIMSALASLALSSICITRKEHQMGQAIWESNTDSLLFFAKQSILIYLFLFPCLMDIQSNNPVGILFNIIFTPLISIFLFPLSFLAYFFDIIKPVFSLALDNLLKLLQILSKDLEITPLIDGKISVFWLWGEYLILFLIIHFFKRTSLRREL